MSLRFDIVTLFPEMILQGLGHGVVGKAFDKGLFEAHVHNPRDMTSDIHKTVDDRPYGGGDGMVMLVDPVDQILRQVKSHLTILLSPQGQKLNSDLAKKLSAQSQISLISARYAGIDQRFINKHVDLEISIGDYILSGGELPILVLIDSVVRFLPGVLGHGESAYSDSFEEGLLEAPSFTRPRKALDQAVPEILLSGNHLEINKWKEKISWLITLQKREDLFQKKINEIDKMNQLKLIRDLKFFLKTLSSDDKNVLNIRLSDIDLEKYE